jgi:hypothetical protein
MQEETAKKLGRAIWHWLEYQAACNKDFMLSEKSLAQPIGELLNSVHKEGVATELPHPNIDKKLKGRGRQIDYALNSKGGKTGAVIESKWAPNAPDVQGIIHDVMRLEYVKKTYSYFILAGLRKNIEEKPVPSGVGKLTKKIKQLDTILPLYEDNEKNISIRDCESTLRKYFEKFSEDYEIPELPNSITVKRVFTSADDRKDKLTHESTYVYIWRIKSSRGQRAGFDPKKTWLPTASKE